MTDLQRKLLDMILEIDEICKRNNIEYYLDGGSVLGAIRHGGFIPWDDDVDLVFTRPNWDKFLSIIDKEKPANRYLDIPNNNQLYPTTSMRYSDTKTTSIFRSLMMGVAHSGICVDLFVLEAFPKDKEKQEQYKRDLSAYIEYLQPFYVVREDCNPEDYLLNIELEKKNGRQNTKDELFNKIDSLNEWDDCEQYIIRWGGNGFQIYDKYLFGKPKYVPFEDTMLPVPEHTNAYLRSHFGEDWYIEPSDKSSPHDTVVDMEIPYINYVNDYKKFINFDNAINFFSDFKLKRMKLKRYKTDYQMLTYKESCKQFAKQFNNLINSLDEKKKASLLKPDRINELYLLCSEYLKRQLNTDLLYYNVFVDVEDKALFYPIYYLMEKGNIKKALKILNLRASTGTDLSEELEGIKKAIELYFCSLSAYENKDIKESKKQLKKAIKILPNVPQFNKHVSLLVNLDA